LSDLRHFAGGFVERFVAFFILGEIEKKARLLEVGAVLLPRLDDVF
jgi:hypothetical protein